jgi:hypothetical protein
MKRMAVMVLVCFAIAPACTTHDSNERAPATEVIEAPAEPKAPVEPEPEPEPEPQPEPELVSLELVARRDGPIDLLTTDGELFLRIEGQLLRVDDRGRPIDSPESPDPAWSWPLLKGRREGVDAFGGSAERPIISLSAHRGRAQSNYGVYRLGGSSAERLTIEHRAIEGFYTQIASWGDRVVALPGWTPGNDYRFEQLYEEHPTDKQFKMWKTVERSLRTAPQGFVSIPGDSNGPVPDLLGLVPMALANDNEGNLHAIAHTLPPDFDPVAVMEEHDPAYFMFAPTINVGLLGGEVEKHTTHEYVHLCWRAGETKPERQPIPGLEQARVLDLHLTTSATLTLVAQFDDSRALLGVLDGGRWRMLSSEGLPPDDEWSERGPLWVDLTIDVLGQAWLLADLELWRLPSSGIQWVRQRLPAAPIPPPDVDEPPPDSPQRRVLENRDSSELMATELAWANGQLWLMTAVGSEGEDLMFRIVDAAATRDDTLTPIELPARPRDPWEDDP